MMRRARVDPVDLRLLAERLNVHLEGQPLQASAQRQPFTGSSLVLSGLLLPSALVDMAYAMLQLAVDIEENRDLSLPYQPAVPRGERRPR